MADLISRKALLEKAWEADTQCGYVQVVDVGDIEDAPAVDAAPVVHGRWMHLGGDEWCCSHCGVVITTEGSWEQPTYKYCHECGAKMDGGNDND